MSWFLEIPEYIDAYYASLSIILLLSKVLRTLLLSLAWPIDICEMESGNYVVTNNVLGSRFFLK